MISSRSRQPQSDLPNLIDTLRGTGESGSLMERVPVSVTSMMQTGITQVGMFLFVFFFPSLLSIIVNWVAFTVT